MERLQKVIASRGYCSRRKAEELIVKGLVRVDGKVIDKLGYKVLPQAKIEVEGILLERQMNVYYMLNKPKGVISSAYDDLGRTVVVDLIQTNSVNERIFPVGRLDYDTTGLLLLTNDGAFTEKMTHPKYKIKKTYVAKIQGIPTQYQLNRLLKGIKIDTNVLVKATDVNIIRKDTEKNKAVIELAITQGRNHQVKKMLEAIGHPVLTLKRVGYGSLELGNMPIGTYRKLNQNEINKLLYLADKGV